MKSKQTQKFLQTLTNNPGFNLWSFCHTEKGHPIKKVPKRKDYMGIQTGTTPQRIGRSIGYHWGFSSVGWLEGKLPVRWGTEGRRNFA